MYTLSQNVLWLEAAAVSTLRSKCRELERGNDMDSCFRRNDTWIPAFAGMEGKDSDKNA